MIMSTRSFLFICSSNVVLVKDGEVGYNIAYPLFDSLFL
jgi:hypothetical protein